MLDAASTAALASTTPSDHHGCIRVRWAVLATYPQAEPWAESNLRQRGYNPFLPRYAARQRDRTIPTLYRVVLRPLFAGYIFCQHNPADPWRPIRYCPGIRANLLGGTGIQYANAGDISVLQDTETLRSTQPPENRLWAPGVPCSLRKGYAFEGLPAVVTAIDQGTAKVAVMFLGELRTLSVPSDALSPVIGD